MAGKHLPIRIGKNWNQILAKKVPETGISAEFRRNSGKIPNQGDRDGEDVVPNADSICRNLT
jgi:hypothetical protein